MSRRSYLRSLPILLSLFGLVPPAHAEPIHWTYKGTVTVPAGYQLNGGQTGYGNLIFSDRSGTGQGSQSVTALGVALGLGDPDSSYSGPFAVNFHITDAASGQSGDFTFHGSLLGGVAWDHGMSTKSSFYSNRGSGSYLDPNPTPLRLGDNLYKVSISPFGVYYRTSWEFTPSGGLTTTSEKLTDTSQVNVDVTSVTTPEPSTLALVASGITALGCGLWRRRQRHGVRISPAGSGKS
jgi:hypothetical protein